MMVLIFGCIILFVSFVGLISFLLYNSSSRSSESLFNLIESKLIVSNSLKFSFCCRKLSIHSLIHSNNHFLLFTNIYSQNSVVLCVVRKGKERTLFSFKHCYKLVRYIHSDGDLLNSALSI